MPPNDDVSPRRARLADTMNQRVVDELVAARSRRRLTAGGALVFVLATAVHAVSFGFLGTGLWLVLSGSNWPIRVLGGLCLLAAAVLAPRFPRAPRGRGLMDDVEFPATAALVRDVAALVGSPIPSRVELSADFNASAVLTGIRGRTVTLGAPLWVACSPQAKVALLGHELGHFAHGDVLHSRYVGSAYNALAVWQDIFTTDEPISYLITSPVRLALRGYARAMELANAASHRRREHYADLGAAVAGGTEGAVDLLETMLAEVGIAVVCNRVGVNPAGPRMWPEIAAYMTSYDASSRSRIRTQGVTEQSRIDDSHPPTLERLRLVESVQRTNAGVVISSELAAQLDDELSTHIDEILDGLAASYR